MKKDRENKELYIGQRVIYTDQNSSKVYLGTVIGFTAQRVKIKTMPGGWIINKTANKVYGI